MQGELSFLVLMKKRFFVMRLFLFIFLDLSMAVRSNDTSTSFGSVESLSRVLTRTERSVGGESNMISVETQFGPYFDKTTEQNVTVQLGGTARLHCKILQLGNNIVAWFSLENNRILTIGRHVITGDPRITSIHPENSDDWTLEIKLTNQQDAGLYMCQINTTPMINLKIFLNVVEVKDTIAEGFKVDLPKATILEGPNLYIQSGSNINLTCAITGINSLPNLVIWKHQNDRITISHSKPVLSTDKSRTYYSRFEIVSAHPRDSGRYLCQTTDTESASITLHVLNGDNTLIKTVAPVTMPMTPASTPVTMHYGQHSSQAFHFMPSLLFLLLPILWLLQK